MKKQLLTLSAIATLTFGVASQAGAESYTVKSGDTLSNIAVSQNISVSSLYELNQLSNDLIHPGQKLEVSKAEVTHIVTKGENLPYIANQYSIPLSQLMNDNKLNSFLIHPGDELIISNVNKKENAVVPVQAVTSSETEVTKNAPVATKSVPKKATKAPQKQVVKTSSPAPVQKEQPKADGKSFTVSATAYTAFCAGCSGVTRTGIDLKANPNAKVIAVDPSVIPLGSRVYVEGYGEAIAGDTGGAIKNNKIDVFIPNKADALKWGRKDVKITILD